jgi:hypothetical protein
VKLFVESFKNVLYIYTHDYSIIAKPKKSYPH